MALGLGDRAPDFAADTTHGRIHFYQWLADSWGILLSHPRDFTPVCTTEIGAMARLKPEFDRRGVKVIGLSVDSVDRHRAWAQDIEATQGIAPGYPLIGDPDLTVSRLYEMLPTSEDDGENSDADAGQALRIVYIIGPDKRIRLLLAYPRTTGRNFDEILRVVDSLQLAAAYPVATPANWRQGDDVLLAGSATVDDARSLAPDGWREPKPYLRIVPQPPEPQSTR